MKNKVLNSFLFVFFLANLILYDYIIGFVWFVSDVFWINLKFDLFCIFLGVALGIAFVIFILYFLKHRDRGDLVCPVEFQCPDDMTPLELGFLVDGVVDGEDLSSLLVYWASKGYVEISKEKENQKLTKLVDKLPEEVNVYEKKIFTAIFGADKEIAVARISDRLQNDKTQSVAYAVETVTDKVGRAYFDSSCLFARQVFVVVFVLLYYVSAMYLWLEYADIAHPFPISFIIISSGLLALCSSWVLNFFDYRHKNNKRKGRMASLIGLFAVAGVSTGLIVWFFWADPYQIVYLLCNLALLLAVVLLSCKMQIYTKAGQEKLGQVLGFKQFLEVAEKDRIKMLVEENPKVYYDVLPYAYVLGVSDKWIKNLGVIRAQMPKEVQQSMVDNLTVTTYFVMRSRTMLNPIVRTARMRNVTNALGGGSVFGGRGGSGGSSRGSRGGGGHHRGGGSGFRGGRR